MPIHARASHLIEQLGLVPHPEGGHFSEVYRSAACVQPADERANRSALTTIYFLLVSGEVSRWHRVASDEVWHYYEGDPLELWSADARFNEATRHVLGHVDDGMRPVQVITAGQWQAARTTGSYTLVGCTVGPGFDFSDFEMLDQAPHAAAAVSRQHPELAVFV